MGCKAAPVKIDSGGLMPQCLEDILAGWGSEHPGERRPHLLVIYEKMGTPLADENRLYLVPVGSNPTGLTMDVARRKEIYEICAKYGKSTYTECCEDMIVISEDIIICEDDPYSFLQFPVYKLGEPTELSKTTPTGYLSTLTPSFLGIDTQGRVIRLDTFSKVSIA